MDSYQRGVSVVAGRMMIKWTPLDSHIRSYNPRLKPGENVNVFINLECVLKNIIGYRGIHELFQSYKQDLVIDIESAILNLAANYRRYFKKEKVVPKIHFYYTNLAFEKQQMGSYNKYYRSYYKNQYMQNPKYKMFGELFNELIVPEVKLIASYIPDCYLLETKTFDGSLIPLIVSNFSDARNVIISSDIFDTLYLHNPNFITIYIRAKYHHLNITSEIPDVVQSIIKDENPFDLSIFNSELYYKLLLSIKGNKIRNIQSARGFGYGKFVNILKKGIDDGVVLKDFESIDSIIEMFPEKYQSDIKMGFQCTNLDIQYGLLSDADIDGIKSQIIDKIDMSSLEALNNKRYLNFPIDLQGLLG